jgi:hypothetical protein
MVQLMDAPEVGRYVLVRKRPAIVRNVSVFNEARSAKAMHFVDLDYIDDYEFPDSDRVIWELEVNAKLIPVLDYPEIDKASSQPDEPDRFRAFTDALRWTSNTQYWSEGNELRSQRIHLLSPWFSAVQVEDYQLYPVLQAMAMPRVNMLLADDVGLGKTIEAGLILQELIRQRRIRRILIVCPASLQIQWQDEMKEKFNLDFVIMDSDQVYQIQRELGMDLNPWMVHPRIITSMDYLKQKDNLGKFKNGAKNLVPEGSAMLPWDMLIVDEAANFMPSRHMDESDRCSMLRQVAPYFEHRLFLTATPHNGHTLSFTGLLELLDPVRFQQKMNLDEEDYKQLNLVMVRRMKSELNKGRRRFKERSISGIPAILSAKEVALFEAMARYREGGTKELGRIGRREKALGGFILQLLTKRLLSSSYAFARTWYYHLDGFSLETFERDQAEESKKRAEQPVPEDEEKERREQDAVRHGAAWLKHYKAVLDDYLGPVSKALLDLGWTKERARTDLSKMKELPDDEKWDGLKIWIGKNLVHDGKLRPDDRLIIFTEYKDTQDYLLERLARTGWKSPAVQTLYGGADASQRRLVKEEFNEPTSQLRILVATDAASEGLNLQTSCRYVIHQEIPWNPMRLEQRNGRVDRHGQTRDVVVHHFVSDQVEDLRFLRMVVEKVHTVREDLGSVGKILDEAVLEHFTSGKVTGETIAKGLDQMTSQNQDKNDLSHRSKGSESDYSIAMAEYEQTKHTLGLCEGGLARLLEQAAIIEKGSLRKEEDGQYRFATVPPRWSRLVENSLISFKTGNVGQPKIVFSPHRVETMTNDILLFRQPKDTRLLMLGHPIMERALMTFRRRLWTPAAESGVSRWTVTSGTLPDDVETIFRITFIVSVGNKLGERCRIGTLDNFYQVGTDGRTTALASRPTVCDLTSGRLESERLKAVLPRLRLHWTKLMPSVDRSKQLARDSIRLITAEELEKEYRVRRKEYEELHELRRKGLLELTDIKSLKKKRDDLEKAEQRMRQMTFNEEINEENRLHYEMVKQIYSDAQWETQRKNVEVMINELDQERKRMLERVLPNRYSLSDSGIQVQTAAVEIVVRSVP